MRLRLAITLAVVGLSNVVSCHAGGGIFLEKLDPWKDDIIAVRRYSRFLPRTNFDTGYRYYYFDEHGQRQSIRKDLVGAVVEVPDVTVIGDILDDAKLAEITALKEPLEQAVRRAPVSVPYVQKELSELRDDVSKYHSGMRRLSGKWITDSSYQQILADRASAEAAEKRRIADVRAAEQKRVEDQRRADEKRVEDERRADERRKADATAQEAQRRADGEAKRQQTMKADARREADQSADQEVHRTVGAMAAAAPVDLRSAPSFAKVVNDRFAKISPKLAALPAATSLKDVKPLAPDLDNDIRQLAELARAFRKSYGYESALGDTAAETLKVDLASAIDEAMKELSTRRPALAVEARTNYYKNRPEKERPSDVGSLEQKLDEIGSFAQRLIAESESHVKHARELADVGKVGEAIKECQVAYEIVPDPGTAKLIKELRSQTLGL